MSVSMIKTKENSVTREVNISLDTLDKTKKALKADPELKGEAKIARVQKLIFDRRIALLAVLEAYINTYEQTEVELKLKYQKECKAYNPLTVLDRVEYYSHLAYYKDVLLKMNCSELEKLYEAEVDEQRIAMIELVISDLMRQDFKGDSGYIRLQSKIEQNQSERISKSLQDDLQYMDDKKQLYGFSTRFQEAVQTSTNMLPASSIYMWLKMTGQDELPIYEPAQVKQIISATI